MAHDHSFNKSYLRPCFNYLLDMLFPIDCVHCGRPGAWLCPECTGLLRHNPESYCLHCYQARPLGKFCPDAAISFSLEGILIAGDYKDEILKNLIKTYKYKSIKDISLILFKYLNDYLDNSPDRRKFIKESMAKNTLVIPVPLHRKRQAFRGFNQSELIAELIAQRHGLAINRNDLRRKKHKRPQAKLNGMARTENLRDNFVWQGENLDGRPIILLDDVTTTGTTLNECARALKQAGAGRIWGLVVAKG